MLLRYQHQHFLHSLNEHSSVHFNLLATHSHEGNWQTWRHLPDVNSSIMSGTGSPVIQLMQSPPVPPLSVLPPSMAILRGRNSRLGLKASSPYCRLVLQCMLVQGIFTWRKLTRLNEPLFGVPEAETQIIHVCVGSRGCTQLAGESMQCFWDA